MVLKDCLPGEENMPGEKNVWNRGSLSNFIKKNKSLFTPEKTAVILLGTALLSFGLYNIHRQTGITEGGVLGLILLINHWTGMKSSLLSPLLDLLCYAFAFPYLGRDFLKVSVVSTLSLAGFFKLWEQFPPMLPDLSAWPLAAALAGGIFVGGGVGLVIRMGGSSGGDDALALTISRITSCRLSRAYLVTDVTVLLLSLSYIPLSRIAFSLITVTLSSFLIDLIQQKGKTRCYSPAGQ
ncbi:MAG: YitT family protein [Peptococcaceae bacterium]|nr:YitT family protein [Peptococcaceae bacterium]